MSDLTPQAALSGRLSLLVAALSAATDRRSGYDQGEPRRLLAMLADEYAVDARDTVDDPVAEVASNFGLSPLEADVLTVAAAPDLDARFGAAYAMLLGSDQWTPTLGLALELCGRGSLEPEPRSMLADTGRLQRHELVAMTGTGPTLVRRLVVAPRVILHLLGSTATDPEVASLSVAVPARRDAVADRLASAFKSGARLAHVRERPGTAGLASARGALELIGLDAQVVDLSRTECTVQEATRLARLAIREAGLGRAGLVLTGVDRAVAADRTVLAELEDAPLPIVVVDDVAWDSEWYRRPMITADATLLSMPERAEMWRAGVDAADSDAVGGLDWVNLVGLRMRPQQIAAAIDTASVLAAADQQTLSVARLQEAAREQGRQRLESAGVRTVPRATLADLILPPQTRQSLEELVSWARNREALLSTGRLTGRGTKGHGLTAMFAGAAGTGKTLAAEAIAGELGLELCTVDLSLVVDKYIGETEKHLEQVISEAENLNVVLFFDEADSLFGSRSAVTDSRDRYANQEVAYLLQRIERFEGLAVLATNLRGNLDPAFTRRLHHIITFTDPDADTRRALWEAHLAEVISLDPDDPLDHDWLAGSVELTGGDIRNIVMTAAFAAAAEQHVGLATPRPAPVGMRHVLYAVEREYRKQAKRMPPPPAR